MPFRSSIGIWFVMMGNPRYICMASPLMISPLNREAKSTASCLQLSVIVSGGSAVLGAITFDLPVPVAPTTAMSGFMIL